MSHEFLAESLGWREPHLRRLNVEYSRSESCPKQRIWRARQHGSLLKSYVPAPRRLPPRHDGLRKSHTPDVAAERPRTISYHNAVLLRIAREMKESAPMTPQERELLTGLFDRLKQCDRNPKEPDADRFIAQAVAAQPSAPYFMAQL